MTKLRRPFDEHDVEALYAVDKDAFADLSQWQGDRLYFGGLVTWDGPERKGILTPKGRAFLNESLSSQEPST